MRLLWDLYRTFFVIGGLTFGGGWLLEKWGVGSEPRVYLILAIGSCIAFTIAAVSFWKFGWRPNKAPEFLAVESKNE